MSCKFQNNYFKKNNFHLFKTDLSICVEYKKNLRLFEKKTLKWVEQTG